MKRDFSQLGGGPFDLLVVGGGVYGAWTAYDAALRGLRVALIEKDDWAGATSSASSKMIHGGLRYLEHGQLGLVRKTLIERRRLARLAPHRVRPLRLLLPAYRGDRVGRTRMRIGLWFYDRLAGRGQPVPPHRTLGPDELLELVDVESGGLLGGFAFGDCRMDDARFVLEVVDGAYRSGATAVNRAMARELLVEDGRVVGAGVEDRESGMTLEVRAMTTVCCAGPWTSGLSASAGSAPVVATRLTKGVHLVLPGLASDDALVINSNDDARIVFLIPWYGRTLLGTTDTDHAGDPGDARVEAADVAYLLERVNRTLRKPRWTEADVIASFAGLRTLPVTSDSHPSNVTREWRLAEPMDGLLVPVGGKYTSARADAAAIVDRVLIRAGWPVRASPTEDRPFPWCPAEPFDAWAVDQVSEAVSLGLDPVTAHTCTLRHGTRVARILELVRDNPDLARRIVPDAPFCRAEIVHAAREEMARSLDDVLRRRIPLILLSRLDAETVCEIAALAAEHLGWNDARCREEAASVISSRRRQDTAP
jgi:glycerol-3-phosphate dehydrogenase